MRFNIQDEVGMLKIDLIETNYQYSLKEKDNLKSKSQGNLWGKEKQDHLAQAKPSVEDEPKFDDLKRRIGRGEFKGNFYRCSEVEHRSFEC